MTKQILSLSLWGNKPKYLVGAIENIKLAKTIYPNWTVRLYTDLIAFNLIQDQLESFDNVESVVYYENGDWNGMFWRFLPATEPDIDIMISRDCDSRISIREKNAVDEWLNSDKDFHIMRDHPYHNTVILGGMWGVRNHLFNRLAININPDDHESFWQVDQNFLRSVVYPKVHEYAFVHDPYGHFGDKCMKDFPDKRSENREFVGEIFDENNNRHPDHYTMISI